MTVLSKHVPSGYNKDTAQTRAEEIVAALVAENIHGDWWMDRDDKHMWYVHVEVPWLKQWKAQNILDQFYVGTATTTRKRF